MSKTSKTDERNWGEPIDMIGYGQWLVRRRAEIEQASGQPFRITRNSGTRRTASKTALLKAIEATGKKW